MRGRLLYYCQSLVGVGHWAASAALVEGLLARFDVDLVYGGPDAGGAPGARLLRLAPLLIDARGELGDPEGRLTLERLWTARERALRAFVRGPYAGVLLEYFPFGRRRFKREVARLLELAGPAPVFSCVGDATLPRPPEDEERIMRELRAGVRAVLVRSDPRVWRLDQAFSRARELGPLVRYTGYVVATPPPPRERGSDILVSQGGSDAGRALLSAAARMARLMPGRRLRLVAGARTPAADLRRLEALGRGGAVEVRFFMPDFRRALAGCALSVSLGGENTLLDVAATRTPALAWPLPGNEEQRLRVERLARLGYVGALRDSELEPARLKARVERALGARYPREPLDLDGARRTGELLAAELLEGACPAR